MSSLFFVLIFTPLLSVQSAPAEYSTPIKQSESYDISQFDEVHDQRQNGTENYRVNLEKIVMVWSPPGGLLTAALLADAAAMEEAGSLDEFLKPEKPEEALVIKPEATSKKPEGSNEGSSTAESTESTTTTAVARKR